MAPDPLGEPSQQRRFNGHHRGNGHHPRGADHPRWGWHAAAELGSGVQANERYWRCLPSEARTIFGDTR
ncbi:MAG: hypothetical protein O3B29_08840, partial [Proteobacteria bacterium]|nr:hypothetical protein [Pseudomonadota bacterium]